MKKILFTLLLSLTLIPGVKAEATFKLSQTQKVLYETAIPNFITYNDEAYTCSGYEECHQKALQLFNESGKQYYYVRLDIDPPSNLAFMYLHTFNFNSTDTYTTTSSSTNQRLYFTIGDLNITVISASTSTGGVLRSTYMLYDTNFNFIADSNYTFSNFYSTDSSDNIIVESGESYPLFKDLIQYDSFAEYKTDFTNIKEVNLDNYEYVILNLKDYSQKEAFETILQVKGSIGITPIYEYGTAEKSTITDICNISYSDFTDYRFFILKDDLINNTIYAVKSCEESSSFRFDSTIFNITYVTAENVDDPVVTIGGQEYHTIPFDKLSNTVNKNTEEGFIPGESGFSLTDIIGNISDYITSFWGSLSTFMSLVTKFFNTLPIEIRAISITCFATACTLGLLKILKS